MAKKDFKSAGQGILKPASMSDFMDDEAPKKKDSADQEKPNLEESPDKQKQTPKTNKKKPAMAKPRKATSAAEKNDSIKIGRPELPKEELLSRKITVNLTEAEYEKVVKISAKHFDVPLGKILRKLLKDQGVF